MKRILAFVVSAAICLLPFPTFAASGITQITVKDAAGTTRNINVTSDTGLITGNLMWNNVICDPTTTTQCAAVNASGQLTALAVQSGAWNITNISGTISLPTGAATAALQGTNTATTAHTCSVAGYSILGCLGQIDDDVKSTGAVNLAQVNGSSYALGSTTASGSMPVVLASNQTAADPCMFQAKSNAAFSVNPNNGSSGIVTGVSAKKIYVCSLSLIAAAATAVSLTEGSSSSCGTSNQAAVIGVASNGTLANGMSLAANGGLTLGNGESTIASTATSANYLCLSSSANANLAGNVTYVQQ